jgi:hypothetical protein
MHFPFSGTRYIFLEFLIFAPVKKKNRYAQSLWTSATPLACGIMQLQSPILYDPAKSTKHGHVFFLSANPLVALPVFCWKEPLEHCYKYKFI